MGPGFHLALSIVFLNLCTYLCSAKAIFFKVGHMTHLHKVAYILFYLFKHIFLDIFTYFGSAVGHVTHLHKFA